MGSWADNAILYDLSVYDVAYTAAESSEPASVSIEDAPEYGSYPSKVDMRVRIKPPSFIDLTHVASLELESDQSLVSERYITVEYATDVGDTDLGNVSDSSFTDKTSTFDSGTTDDTHVLDSSVTGGEVLEVHALYLVSQSEADALQSTSGGAAGMGPQSGGGGIFGFSPLQAIGGALAAFASFLGLRRLGV